ncbi:hypothetical protein RJ639_029378 [Escallonia herrerae]|uniref:Uncharacterized protein n=1 Tax=Escallonia herrerae TaxID=1293975 RepID=A0AA88X845_9ASTE|nr:hypothetical protein RJ639_029378 [Escallonia herrerae]
MKLPSQGIKCIHYCTLSPAAVGYMSDYGRELVDDKWTEEELMKPPPGFPCSSIRLHPFECRGMAVAFNSEYGKGMLLAQRLSIAFTASDAIAFNTCVEMEGPYCDFLEKAFGKPLILAGPILPDPPTIALEERWASWLEGFKPKTVIYCSLGTEIVLKKDQFQELVLERAEEDGTLTKEAVCKAIKAVMDESKFAKEGKMKTDSANIYDIDAWEHS